jgi:ribosomal protein S6
MPITEDHKEAQVYELGYLVLPSVPEEGLEKVVSNIRSIIEKAGGKTLDGEDPVLDDLAYSMSKTIGARKYVVDEAYIGWMKFEAESSMIEAVKTGVEKIDEILRHLLIKVPRETTFTFAEARQARAEREAALQAAEARQDEPVAEEVVAEEKPAEVVPEAVVE